MSQVALSASTNREIGSRPVRRLRAEGLIPGVVYGEGVTPLPVSVNAKEFRTAVSGEQGLNTLITLEADGTSYTVMAREIQRHPFERLAAGEEVEVLHVVFASSREDDGVGEGGVQSRQTDTPTGVIKHTPGNFVFTWCDYLRNPAGVQRADAGLPGVRSL